MDQNASLCDFHEEWVKIVDKGLQDYSSLTPPERVWFNVQGLIGQVGKGGLVSFYYNSYADYVCETIEDLLILGQKSIAHLLEQMNALFPGCDIAKDFSGRNEIIASWDERIEQLLDDYDDEYFQRDEELEKVLIEYIIKNNLASFKNNSNALV